MASESIKYRPTPPPSAPPPCVPRFLVFRVSSGGSTSSWHIGLARCCSWDRPFRSGRTSSGRPRRTSLVRERRRASSPKLSLALVHNMCLHVLVTYPWRAMAIRNIQPFKHMVLGKFLFRCCHYYCCCCCHTRNAPNVSPWMFTLASSFFVASHFTLAKAL